jgi:hypothetical protein
LYDFSLWTIVPKQLSSETSSITDEIFHKRKKELNFSKVLSKENLSIHILSGITFFISNMFNLFHTDQVSDEQTRFSLARKSWSFQGELNKWIGLSPARWKSISAYVVSPVHSSAMLESSSRNIRVPEFKPEVVLSNDKRNDRKYGEIEHLLVEAAGVPGEHIKVGFIDPNGVQHIVECDFNEGGMLKISSEGACLSF